MNFFVYIYLKQILDFLWKFLQKLVRFCNINSLCISPRVNETSICSRTSQSKTLRNARSPYLATNFKCHASTLYYSFCKKFKNSKKTIAICFRTCVFGNLLIIKLLFTGREEVKPNNEAKTLSSSILIHGNELCCKKCDFRSRDEDSFQHHLLTECTYYKTKFKEKAVVTQLAATINKKTSSFHCSLCEFKCKEKRLLNWHLRIQHTAKEKAQSAEKVFSAITVVINASINMTSLGIYLNILLKRNCNAHIVTSNAIIKAH